MDHSILVGPRAQNAADAFIQQDKRIPEKEAQHPSPIHGATGSVTQESMVHANPPSS